MLSFNAAVYGLLIFSNVFVSCMIKVVFHTVFLNVAIFAVCIIYNTFTVTCIYYESYRALFLLLIVSVDIYFSILYHILVALCVSLLDSSCVAYSYLIHNINHLFNYLCLDLCYIYHRIFTNWHTFSLIC